MRNLFGRTRAALCGMGVLVILATMAKMFWVHNSAERKQNIRLFTQESLAEYNVEDENSKRVNNLREQCVRLHDEVKEENPSYDHIIVNDEYKMLFCYIPKISCSQWKTIFIKLTGKVTNTSVLNFGSVHRKYQNKMDFFSQYSREDRRRIIGTYKKYIFVRNPFERILSAYRNKLAGKGFHERQFQDIGRHIVKTHRPDANATSLRKGNDVSFFEFVQYLTDSETKEFNDHWEKYTTLCHPCQIKYDFIGKYETINEDADFLLEDINAPTDIQFPPRSAKYNTTETIETFSKFYSEIPDTHLVKLWDVYKNDFDLFGYTFKDTMKLIS